MGKRWSGSLCSGQISSISIFAHCLNVPAGTLTSSNPTTFHLRIISPLLALASALPSGASDAVVTAAEWPVLARADGNRTLGELVRVTGLNAFAVCSAVHRLVGRGLLVALDA